MENVLVLIVGIAVGAIAVYTFKAKQGIAQPRTYIADEQRYRKAREVQYVTSWDAKAARNANKVSN